MQGGAIAIENKIIEYDKDINNKNTAVKQKAEPI